MLDIKFIRENAAAIKDAAVKKNLDSAVIDELLNIDAKRRELMTLSENLRAEQKKTQDREAATKLKEQFKEQEEKLKPLEKRFRELMVRVPNIISPDTPVGKDESENKEVFRWIPTATEREAIPANRANLISSRRSHGARHLARHLGF